MEKQCQKCGSKMYHNEGISKKNNEPYENWKCGNKSCGTIEWVDLRNKPKVGAYGAYQQSDRDEVIRKNMEIKAEGMAKGAIFNKSVDIAIAMYHKGDITADVIVQKVAELKKQLEPININGENLQQNPN